MALPANPNSINEPLSDIGEYIENIIHNHDLGFEVCLPVVVVSYDRIKNRVTVIPAIKRVTTSGEMVSRAQIVVPCHNPCGGGIAINYPIKQGDTGWVIAGDRDASLFLQTLKEAIPNTYSKHLYQFGVFIPDKINNVAIAAEDSDALVIQTLDSVSKISIQKDKIKIATQNVNAVFSPSSLDVVGDTNIDGNVAIVGDVDITGNVTETGNMSVNGNITVLGGDVVADGISLKNHTHGSVMNGDGKTSPPVAQ